MARGLVAFQEALTEDVVHLSSSLGDPIEVRMILVGLDTVPGCFANHLRGEKGVRYYLKFH